MEKLQANLNVEAVRFKDVKEQEKTYILIGEFPEKVVINVGETNFGLVEGIIKKLLKNEEEQGRQMDNLGNISGDDNGRDNTESDDNKNNKTKKNSKL